MHARLHALAHYHDDLIERDDSHPVQLKPLGVGSLGYTLDDVFVADVVGGGGGGGSGYETTG